MIVKCSCLTGCSDNTCSCCCCCCHKTTTHSCLEMAIIFKVIKGFLESILASSSFIYFHSLSTFSSFTFTSLRCRLLLLLLDPTILTSSLDTINFNAVSLVSTRRLSITNDDLNKWRKFGPAKAKKERANSLWSHPLSNHLCNHCSSR